MTDPDTTILDVNDAAFRPVRTVEDVTFVCEVQPLQPGSPAWADLAPARRSDALKKLETKLRLTLKTQKATVKLAFGSHLGTGKSTELNRLLARLEDDRLATALPLQIDPELIDQLDWTLLVLWTASALAQAFHQREMPLDNGPVEAVARWFASELYETAERSRIETSATTQAQAKAGGSVFGFGLAYLTQIAAGITHSRDRTKTVKIKGDLVRIGDTLIDQMNLLLRHARSVLQRHGKPDRLILAFDNLEKLPAETAAELFGAGERALMRLDVDCVFTAPLALETRLRAMEVWSGGFIGLPAPCVCDEHGQAFEPGITALAAVVAKRIHIDVFAEGDATIRQAVTLSGGSVRHLMLILGEAALDAVVAESPTLSIAHVDAAAQRMAQGFQRALLRERRRAFPILAEIDATKRLPREEQPEDASLMARLMSENYVFEHANGDTWYDVHPLLRRLAPFQDEVAHRVQAPASDDADAT